MQRPSLPAGLRGGSAASPVKAARLSIDRTSRRRTSKFAGFVLPSFPPALGFEHLGQKNAAFSGSSLTVSQVTSV